MMMMMIMIVNKILTPFILIKKTYTILLILQLKVNTCLYIYIYLTSNLTLARLWKSISQYTIYLEKNVIILSTSHSINRSFGHL